MERRKNEKLEQEFNDLEAKWESIKQQKRRPRNLHRSFTDTRPTVKNIHLLDNSPRKLMSSLQHRRLSSSSGPWKVRTNDLAVLEILNERQAAIESGRLKGRRLFDTNESGNGDSNDDIVQDISEVRSVFSYDSYDDDEDKEISNGVERTEEGSYPPVYASSSSTPSSSSTSSYVCDECMEKEMVTEGEQAATGHVVVKSRDYKSNERDENCAKNRIVIGLILLFGIGFVIIRSFAGGNERFLVPT